jgi:hypothetical protein
MREKDFSIYNKTINTRITGGHLWKVPSQKTSGGIVKLDKNTRKLSIFLRPDDTYIDLQNGIYALIKDLHPFFYLFLVLIKKLPSLMMLAPITLTVLFLAVVTVWGEFIIYWVFLKENSMTVFGVFIRQAAFYSTIICILFIYFFPVLLKGEQDSFIKALNNRFFNREQLKSRLVFLLKFLRKRKLISECEI